MENSETIFMADNIYEPIRIYESKSCSFFIYLVDVVVSPHKMRTFDQRVYRRGGHHHQQPHHKLLMFVRCA